MLSAIALVILLVLISIMLAVFVAVVFDPGGAGNRFLHFGYRSLESLCIHGLGNSCINSSCLKVAVTGTIASGKSTVGGLLQSKGFAVLDTDEVTHRLLQSDATIKARIVELFGPTVLDAAGNPDRASLARLVFKEKSESARKQLEAILHPAIRQAVNSFVEAHSTEPAVFVLVPLLYESGWHVDFDCSWVVAADEAVLRERLKKRNGYSDEQIEARLKTQMPQVQKIEKADLVVWNNGSPELLAEKVRTALLKIGMPLHMVFR